MLGSRQTIAIKQVDQTLVAGFHRANPPLIWKFDLERNHSFAINLQGEDGDWELGLTSPKGDFYAIARFINREDAEEAFNALQKALMKKKIPLPALPKSLLGWVGLILAFLVLFGVLHIVRVYSLQHGLSMATMSTTGNAIKPGIPQSADDILVPPK